ncbi:SMI1/KNR4 family protein [Streptomyces sp. TLI_171]|uniref:SMI1/KNR4 family protein n=1 Tax=Streptomyces sp. TLI_171 TaxID=1938859 RepID=UPI000C641D52|nr:SMI1/KNR4 family protein [Streptomyces sp. TLI_171]RKE16967.1 hypothetical protein BX266_0215 [Streptomyces sp. TLI_171]
MAEPFEFDEEDNGIDLESFDGFLTAEETTEWFRAWTGNAAVTGSQFRVFAQDGTGGYAAFWLVRDGRELADQPVVFLGSEGETGVVARDLADFLWLLAGGLGPGEAADEYRRSPDLPADGTRTAVAERFAPERRRPPLEIVESAGAEFPGFEAFVMELCE